MSNESETTALDGNTHNSRKEEFGTILFLVLVVAPAIAVGFVGAYGFIVWMLQLVMGPPTH